MFSSPQVLTLAEQIAQHIKLAILDGIIKPGERLPGEYELSTNFGVSRPTIRQALDILCEEKILYVRRGRGGGHFIVPRITEENYRSLQGFIPSEYKNININQFKEVRNIVQLKSYELALLQCTKGDIDKLRDLIPDIKKDSQLDFSYKLVNFQTSLTRLSDNQFLISNMIPIARTLRMIFLQIEVPKSVQMCYIENLENVFVCLADKKKDIAEESMQNCLEECNQFISTHLNKEPSNHKSILTNQINNNYRLGHL